VSRRRGHRAGAGVTSSRTIWPAVPWNLNQSTSLVALRFPVTRIGIAMLLA
jgi:hypothetical protein